MAHRPERCRENPRRVVEDDVAFTRAQKCLELMALSLLFGAPPPRLTPETALLEGECSPKEGGVVCQRRGRRKFLLWGASRYAPAPPEKCLMASNGEEVRGVHDFSLGDCPARMSRFQSALVELSKYFFLGDSQESNT